MLFLLILFTQLGERMSEQRTRYPVDRIENYVLA